MSAYCAGPPPSHGFVRTVDTLYIDPVNTTVKYPLTKEPFILDPPIIILCLFTVLVSETLT